jgi:type IV pilus assembly protein PilC
MNGTKNVASEFYTELALLVQSKMPLPESLRTLEKSLRKRGMRKMVGILGNKVSDGNSLSKAMSDQTKYFPAHYLAIIEAGERENLLPEALHEVARQSRFSERMLEVLKTGSLYPVLILFCGILIFGYVLLTVVPGFESIYTELLDRKPLPGITLLLINLSKYCTLYLRPLLGIYGLLTLFGFYLFSCRSASPLLASMLRLLPPYFSVFQQLNMSRFCGLWSVMMRQKVPAPDAFKIIADMTGGSFGKSLRKASIDCGEGKTPVDTLAEQSTISGMVITAMKYLPDDEQAKEFKKLSEHFEQSAATAATRVGVILEISLICLCSIFVGTLIIAMFMPVVRIFHFL